MRAYILNLADLAFTLYAIQRGGVELNPLMRNPAVMVAWKVCGVGVLCYLLSKLASNFNGSCNNVARWGLNLCTAVYAALCIYHFYYIFGGAF